jgi:hypothetical protein
MGELVPIHERSTGKGPRVALTVYVERDGLRPLRGMLSDISLEGASVWTAETELPDLFVLRLGGKMRRACEVVWRKNHTVGVRFVGLERMLRPSKKAAETEKRFKSAFLKRTAEELP